MISFVTWKWSTPGYRSKFTGEHVNTLARMIGRHYAKPHRVICVTDDATGIGPGVEVLPDWKDFTGLQSPHGAHAPSCYRRLRAFHPDIGEHFGARFALIDLDVVVTADLAPVFDRTESLVIWRDPTFPRQYNGSLILMDAGARPLVWSSFNPERSPQIARGAGFMGSDQAWLTHSVLDAATFDTADGIYSYRRDVERQGKLPDDARLVIFHGSVDPWSDDARRSAWVRRHYC